MSEINDDAMTCQRRRAEAAYANTPEGQAETRARAGDGWVAESDGMLCATTVFGVIPGVADGKMGRSETASDLTPKPPLSTPSSTRKEAVDS